jgi:hypothetical protein
MASPRAIAWVDRLIWTFLYTGLLMVVLGIATHGAHLIAGWSLGVVGGAVAAAGAVMLWVRSRMRDDGADAQSSASQTRGKT